jgi:hypothetical protein
MMKMMILKVEMMMIVKKIIIKKIKDFKYAVKCRARRKIIRAPVKLTPTKCTKLTKYKMYQAAKYK